MNIWQISFLWGLGLLSLGVFFKGLMESVKKANAFGDTYFLFWLGIFVWADAMVFGLFWFLTAVFTYFLNDWILFLLIVSVFWAVRSLGETVYWLNQQFSTLQRNSPEKMRGFKLVKNDAVWFLYQIVWQCVSVVSIILTIYFAKIWLQR